MHFKLLSNDDQKAIDALKQYHGGASEIMKTMNNMRKYEARKKVLAEKGFGNMIEQAEQLVKKFGKLSEFERAAKISYNQKLGVATSQVSGFQGAKATFRCIKRMAESAATDVPVLVPAELISVMALTDDYVYNGDLLATLTMAENIMQVSKFCNTNLIGIPQPEKRFQELEKVTEKKFPRIPAGNGMSQLKLMNQGTFFGNFGGIEVSNDNHLIYLDGITRCAKTTGGNFYLNPSWSSIIAICYYGRDLPDLYIKISMLLSTQNLMQFRMLLNIIKEYLRDDKTSPIYEVNIGNAVTPENFIKCSNELKESGIKGVSLAAHIFINPDLGAADYNWFDNAIKVLQSGTNMTFKYESDGTAREMDTMEAYFISKEELDAKSDIIGDVMYYKCLQCTKDAREFMKRGIRVTFGKSSL
jgi:hypothetical protein